MQITKPIVMHGTMNSNSIGNPALNSKPGTSRRIYGSHQLITQEVTPFFFLFSFLDYNYFDIINITFVGFSKYHERKTKPTFERLANTLNSNKDGEIWTLTEDVKTKIHLE